MTERSFDALTRALGRRRAVQAFAAAAATTLSGVTMVGAKSNNGNNNKKQKKVKKKALALCANQVPECLAQVGSGGAEILCCQELADCDFAGLIACLNAA